MKKRLTGDLGLLCLGIVFAATASSAEAGPILYPDTLNSGTSGVIEGIQTPKSGNTVLNGKFNEENYWLPYDPDNIKGLDDKGNPTTDPSRFRGCILTKDISALKDKNRTAARKKRRSRESAHGRNKTPDDLNQVVNSVGNPKTISPESANACNPAGAPPAVENNDGPDGSAYNPEGAPRAPLTDANTNPNTEGRQMWWKDDGYSILSKYQKDPTQSAGAQNVGILIQEGVKEKKGESKRNVYFTADNGARQDMHMLVEDNADPSGGASNTMQTSVYFFPRKYLPAVKVDGNDLRVTLPTGEEAFFDKATGKMKDGGALSSVQHTGPSSAKVDYKGTGVILQATAKGQFDPEDADAQGDVIIRKPSDGKDCKVKRSDVFVQTAGSPTTPPVSQFKFPDDNGFNEFLKKACSFSL